MILVRQNMLVVAAAALLSGLAVATATPYQSDARSGQSLVFAEQACLDYGVTPHTAAFENCVSRAARAFDRGQPDMAYMQARSTRDALDVCRSYGLSPETLGYHQCVDTQIDQRTSRTTLIRHVSPSN